MRKSSGIPATASVSPRISAMMNKPRPALPNAPAWISYWKNSIFPLYRSCCISTASKFFWKTLFSDLARNHLHLPGDIDFQAMVRAQTDRCRADLAAELKAVRDLIAEVQRIEPRTVSITRAQEILADFNGISADLEAGRHARAAEHLNQLKLTKPGGRGRGYPEAQEFDRRAETGTGDTAHPGRDSGEGATAAGGIRAPGEVRGALQRRQRGASAWLAFRTSPNWPWKP